MAERKQLEHQYDRFIVCLDLVAVVAWRPAFVCATVCVE